MDNPNPLLVDTGGGFSILYKNRHLYAVHQPIKSAEKKVKEKSLRPGTVYFVPSPLLFYGMTNFLAVLPESSLIIALEVDEKLFSLSHSAAEAIPSDSRLVYFYKSLNKALDYLKQVGIWKYRRVELLSLSGGYALNRAEYDSMLHILTHTVKEYWQNRITVIHMGPLWIKNIFTNIKTLSNRKNENSLRAFSSFEYSKPILVAGAGESIESSISDIKKNRDKIFILAVDTALHILNSHDITPDALVAVDAQIFNMYDVYDFKNSSIPLFFDLSCYPGMVRNFAGELIPFLSLFCSTTLITRLSDALPSLPVLPALGSVGITAVYIASMLTTGPILYTGLDFSYIPGKSHAKGAPAHIRELVTSERFSPVGSIELFFRRPFSIVTGKGGDRVHTNSILLSYAGVMKDYFYVDERIIDIGKTGLVTSKYQKTSIDEALNYPKNFNNTKRNSPLSSIRTDTLKAFLIQEEKYLSLLYSTIFLWLSERKGEEKDIILLLKENNYLYFQFPDQSPEPRISDEYLKRILVSISHYHSILKNLLITL